MAAAGVFVIFTLLNAPLFSTIAFTRGIRQVVGGDNPNYYLMQQAFAQGGIPEPGECEKLPGGIHCDPEPKEEKSCKQDEILDENTGQCTPISESDGSKYFDILVVGDSVMWGQGLREDDNFIN